VLWFILRAVERDTAGRTERELIDLVRKHALDRGGRGWDRTFGFYYYMDFEGRPPEKLSGNSCGGPRRGAVRLSARVKVTQGAASSGTGSAVSDAMPGRARRP